MRVKIQVPRKFQPLSRAKRFKVFYGGRGGAKTITACDVALINGSKKTLRILGLREFMNSIDDSIHATLEDRIHAHSLYDFYQIQRNQIQGANGTLFRYAGLSRNLGSIKSKHNFDIALVEEAQTVRRKSLDVLIPTIRAAGSELWFLFNPENEDDPVYEDFVLPYKDILDEHGVYENDELVVVKTNLTDNPFAPRELLDHSAKMKEDNFKKWLHIYGGECGGNYEEGIFEADKFESYEVLPAWEYKAIFCDTALKDGEQNDYTVFQCWVKYKGRIYLVDQFRAKIKATYLKERLLEFWEKHKAQSSVAQPLRALYVEDKVSGTQLIQDIQREGGIPVIGVPRPRGNGKLLRANNFSPWISSGLVFLPKREPWVHGYRKEFRNFTSDDSHSYDDQVDPTLDAIAYMLVDGAPIKKADKNKPASRPMAPPKSAQSW